MATESLVAETIDIKKYYFVAYHNYIDQLNQAIIDIHPLEWQPMQFIRGLPSSGATVISWQELSKQEYEQFKDHF